MSPARVRSARAAQVAAFPEAYRPGEKNLSSEKGGKCARAGEKPSLLGLVRAAEPRSLGVAAGNCGGLLPLSALLPPSRRPRGRGGDVSAPPRPPPRAPDPGAPAGSASRTVAAVSGQSGLASCRSGVLRSRRRSVRPSPPRRVSPGAAEPRHLSGPAARTSSAGFLASLLRPRFPRLELQVMLFPFCR